MTNYTFQSLIDFTRTTSGTFVGSNGLIQTTPASVNLLLRSQEFDNASWIKNAVTVTANTTGAPDGTSTADTFTESATTDTHIAYQTNTFSAFTTHTISAYFKAGTRSFAMLRIGGGGFPAGVGPSIKASLTGAGTTTTLEGPVSSSAITSVGDGWYRVSMTFISTATTAGYTPQVGPHDNGTSITYLGDGSTVFIWGAQLEVVPDADLVLGSDRVTNGDFASGSTGWTLSTGWAVASGEATFTANGTNAGLQQSGVTASTAGKTYRVSYTVVANTLNAGNFRVGGFSGNSFFGGTAINLPTVVGVNVAYVYVATPSGTGTVLDFYVNTAATSGTLTIDNITVKEITGTVGMPSTYTRNNGGVYPPRFDYDPTTLLPKGILIEEQRVNLLTYSAQFDNAAWFKDAVTVAANATTSPDGTNTADKSVEDTSNSIHRVSQLFTATASVAYAATIYAKASGSRRLYFNCLALMNAAALFDLTGNGSVVATAGTAANLAASITSVGNGWYRCAVVGTGTGAAARVWAQTNLSSSTTANDESYLGDGVSGLFLWGAQLEAGGFPTSYITTVASTVTRARDQCSIVAPMFAPWYNQSEGTLLIEALLSPNVDAGSGNYYAAISDGTSANAINIVDSSGTVSQVVTGGVTQFNQTVGAEPTGILKAALAYASNNTVSSANGAIGTTDTSVTLPTVTSLLIGIRGDASGSTSLNGHIRSIRYYPVRLSDTQLQALTA